MKTILFSVIILLSTTMKLVGQGNSFQLPGEWGKTFVISVARAGSMSGGTSHVTFTHDSCKYETTSLQAKSKMKSFLLSPKDRELILVKMRELKVEKVKSVMSLAPQNDGWSTLLCLGGHCIEGGSASEMSDKDKGIFLNACSFLEEFARKRNKT